LIVALFANFGFEIARAVESISLTQLEWILLWIIILIPGCYSNLVYSVSSKGIETIMNIRLKWMMQLLVVIAVAELILVLNSVPS